MLRTCHLTIWSPAATVIERRFSSRPVHRHLPLRLLRGVVVEVPPSTREVLLPVPHDPHGLLAAGSGRAMKPGPGVAAAVSLESGPAAPDTGLTRPQHRDIQSAPSNAKPQLPFSASLTWFWQTQTTRKTGLPSAGCCVKNGTVQKDRQTRAIRAASATPNFSHSDWFWMVLGSLQH